MRLIACLQASCGCHQYILAYGKWSLKKDGTLWDFSGGLVPCFEGRGVGSIPGWGTKIPHAVRCSQKINFGKKKKDDTLQMQGGLIIIVVKITTTIIMQITETLSALGE